MTQARSARVLTLGVALLLACSASRQAQVAPTFSPAAVGAKVTAKTPREQSVVDASSLQKGVARLAIDEQAEQIADWAVAGALAEVLRQQPEALQAVGRLPPLRRGPRYEVLGLSDCGQARRVGHKADSGWLL